MKSPTYILVGIYTLLGQAAAVGVVGTAPGFAASTTGGGTATPQYPADITELTTWLTDSTARVIALNKEFNFIGSEGTATETGCRPASNTCPDNGGQDAINQADWCTNGNAGTGATSIQVTYDKAGITPINVGSNKSLIGIGSSGVIRGKGLRIANGATNVIIQNIHITELNPQYIWGGDAITVAGSDLVWVDHCKVSLVAARLVRLLRPRLRHRRRGYVVAEGNVFQDVVTPLLENKGSLFSSPSTSANTACAADLDHNCQMNTYGNSGAFDGSDTSFFSDFSGQTVASADAASTSISSSAGVGVI
ncbi:putative pectin lyase F [Lachnellula willkommii]|uniref:pectin lyase n=1 Tax=Lachnellula willkommii TaxID=215461 RepID=A0A559MIQ7_9HELO|nr:putative pectin lyase F [Lachnellula willkommii]